jgi:hypothetical protein
MPTSPHGNPRARGQSDTDKYCHLAWSMLLQMGCQGRVTQPNMHQVCHRPSNLRGPRCHQDRRSPSSLYQTMGRDVTRGYVAPGRLGGLCEGLHTGYVSRVNGATMILVKAWGLLATRISINGKAFRSQTLQNRGHRGHGHVYA